MSDLREIVALALAALLGILLIVGIIPVAHADVSGIAPSTPRPGLPGPATPVPGQAGPRGAPPAAPVAPQWSAGQVELCTEINEARAANGLSPFIVHDILMGAVQDYTEALLDNYTSCQHGDAAGRHSWDYAYAAGYDYNIYAPHVGEVVACNFTSAADAVAGWLGSPPHQAILLGDYDDVGCGYAEHHDVNGGVWTRHVAMVADNADPTPTPRPPTPTPSPVFWEPTGSPPPPLPTLTPRPPTSTPTPRPPTSTLTPRPPTPTPRPPTPTLAPCGSADANGDGRITIVDIQAIASRWGQECR